MASMWGRGGLTWRELGHRLWQQIWLDDVMGRCAELSYYFLFSIFPALFFVTTLFGYWAAAPELRASLFLYLARVSPTRDVFELLVGSVREVAEGRGGAKLWLSLLAALWVSSNAMLAVGKTLNVACGLKETRRWWRRRLVAIVLTLVFGGLTLSALALILYGATIGNTLAERLGIGASFAVAWHLVQWPLVLLFVVISFEMVYNYGPDLGEGARREWWTPGAVTGVALWLAASFGLRLYFAYFDTFSKTYGSLGAVIALLTWFYLTAFAILMGGEVNSEIGHAMTAAGLRGGPRRHRLRMLRRRLAQLRRRPEQVDHPVPTVAEVAEAAASETALEPSRKP
jgi:membrane protein